MSDEQLPPDTSGRPRRPWPRWSAPAMIVALGMVGLTAIRVWPYEEGKSFPAQIQAFSAVVLLICGALLGVWWLVYSGVRWKYRLLPFLMLVIAAASVKIEFSGDMTPLLHWRWERPPGAALPTPALTKADAQAEAQTSVDLDFPPDQRCTNYRGENRDGVIPGPPLVVNWKEHPPKLLWKQPCGGGYAGFVVAGNLAVTIEQRGESEAVVGYDATTGKVHWIHEYPARFEESLGGDGPRATPTLDGGVVYSLGGTGELCTLDALTGKLLWKRNVLEDAHAGNLKWGMAGSPLIVDRWVVVNPGGRNGRELAAYDRETGEPSWYGGTEKAAYSSPQLATLVGKRQIVLFDGKGVAGFDPTDGVEWWRFPWETMEHIHAAQPLILGDDRVYISSGYAVGGAMVQVTQTGESFSARPLWKNRSLRCKFSSAVAYGPHIFGLDEGILVCLEAETGERLWKKGRFGHGQMLRVADVLLILSETGEVVAVSALSSGYQELGRFAAVEGKTWNNPTLAGNLLFVRNHLEMACFQLQRANSEDPTVSD